MPGRQREGTPKQLYKPEAPEQIETAYAAEVLAQRE